MYLRSLYTFKLLDCVSGFTVVCTVLKWQSSWLHKCKEKTLATTVCHSMLIVLQFLSLRCKVFTVTHISWSNMTKYIYYRVLFAIAHLLFCIYLGETFEDTVQLQFERSHFICKMWCKTFHTYLYSRDIWSCICNDCFLSRLTPLTQSTKKRTGELTRSSWTSWRARRPDRELKV